MLIRPGYNDSLPNEGTFRQQLASYDIACGYLHTGQIFTVKSALSSGCRFHILEIACAALPQLNRIETLCEQIRMGVSKNCTILYS